MSVVVNYHNSCGAYLQVPLRHCNRTVGRDLPAYERPELVGVTKDAPMFRAPLHKVFVDLQLPPQRRAPAAEGQGVGRALPCDIKAALE